MYLIHLDTTAKKSSNPRNTKYIFLFLFVNLQPAHGASPEKSKGSAK